MRKTNIPADVQQTVDIFVSSIIDRYRASSSKKVIFSQLVTTVEDITDRTCMAHIRPDRI